METNNEQERTIENLDIELSQEDILLANLSLLGMDISNLNKQMFAKANIQAMEQILYFILGLMIPPTEFKGGFLTCFPARDAKDHREFKACAVKFITKLQSEGKLPATTLVGRGVLDLAYGEKLVSFLRTLSDYCVLHVLKKDFPWETPPQFEFENQEQNVRVPRSILLRAKRAILLHIKGEVEKFNTRARHQVLKQKTWLEHAEFLTNQFQTLRESLSQLEPQGGQEESSDISKQAELERLPMLNTIRYQWQLINGLYEEIQERKGFYAIDKIQSNNQTENTLNCDGMLDEIVFQWKILLNDLDEQIMKNLRSRKKGSESPGRVKSEELFDVQMLEAIVDRELNSHGKQLQSLIQLNSDIQETTSHALVSFNIVNNPSSFI